MDDIMSILMASCHHANFPVFIPSPSLRADIMVKNYLFSDELLGRVDIPLISLDMVKNHEQAYLVDCSENVRAEAALEKAMMQGLVAPKLYVTMVEIEA